MALRDYYRCKKCDAKIAYNPDRSDEDWEPFLLCRTCIAELQSQLDALTWTEITPENLPKIGDELFAHHVFRDAQWDTVSSVTNIHATWRVDDFLNCGWTHFRPINPPPPSSAKGGDDGKSN